MRFSAGYALNWRLFLTEVMLFINVIARCIILILSFYAFWWQPKGVYVQVQWSQFFPALA